MGDNKTTKKTINKVGDVRGLHPNSLANLRNGDWKPGQSGNPKGCSLKRLLYEHLEKPLGKVAPDAPAKELFIAAQLRDAIKGSKEDRREIWERVEGKVTLTIAGDDGGAIKVEIDAPRLLAELQKLAGGNDK